MHEKIKWAVNTIEKSSDSKLYINLLAKNEIEKVQTFHKSFAEYKPTPLVSLDNLAHKIGVNKIFVKDESFRFGLNAFKVLGGSFAIGNYIAKKLDKDISELSATEISSENTKRQVGDITFYTATDGNHGRGVAWTANKLHQKSVIYMPAGSSQTRLANIKKEGAQATITELNYDDAVRLADKEAKSNNGIIVQDTAWENYEEIPTWIMQGYSTMVMEAVEQLKSAGVDRPTHVFMQAGVGSLAASVQGVVSNVYAEQPPITAVVEANVADCFYKSAIAGDGKSRCVGGAMQTIMAGLACGEPNTIGWEILKNNVAVFVSCPDWVAADGMRTLAKPIANDNKVVSGESGAVTTGLLVEIMTNPEYDELRQALKLDSNSKVLVFSTEGDTDPDMYNKIVNEDFCKK